MASIYDLKPAFQRRLRPVCGRLAGAGVTANQVTLAALGLSLAMGAALWLSGGAAWALWLVPVALLLRMGLNAIDGMLAREHGQASRLGALLNELADLASDAALYLPFALVAGVSAEWVVAVVVVSLIAEAAGILGPMIGASRRYDGPFGKSDRATAFGFAAVLLASGALAPLMMNWALIGMTAMAAWTTVNRMRGALEETAEGGA
jgi:CDP-diacylglycerol--glycerol-3-phosphate 3-phosphatidyltransferase